ncbi:hypothetical protein [Pseudooctadecabacter sp.]|uniref:hypothetical protein n=1 Tax=Pseudooctadecabacter sp. TaxID=1966338 RepID=UPI0025EBEF8F|nr:hypothetical protein [Pseudooctadecabacter sp.]
MTLRATVTFAVLTILSVATAGSALADPVAGDAVSVCADPQMDVAARKAALSDAGWSVVDDADQTVAIARTLVLHDGVTMLQQRGDELTAFVDRLAPSLVAGIDAGSITMLSHTGTDAILVTTSIDIPTAHFDCSFLMSDPALARAILVDDGPAAEFFAAGTTDPFGNASFFALERDIEAMGWEGDWAPQSGQLSVLNPFPAVPDADILPRPALFKLRTALRFDPS